MKGDITIDEDSRAVFDDLSIKIWIDDNGDLVIRGEHPLIIEPTASNTLRIRNCK